MSKLLKSLALTATLSLMPVSAFAANIPDAGEEAGPGMSVLETFMWFIAAPAAIIGVVTFLWALSGWRKSAKANEVEIVK
ncbi:MAG: hypothetical protein RL038_1237 [Actinomycetota bacterium]|jgi:hypothetical protein